MDLDNIARSIVSLRASIPEDGFTAGILGDRREGSGVVIGEDGLVLTIGYLITEAEEVWLTRHDGTVIAAHPLAYDQETGFGLVQTLGALDLPALEFGDSNSAGVGDRAIMIDGSGQAVEADIVARQEFAGYWEYLIDEAIFTAPAHPSWGGAALVNTEGRLVGVGSLRLQMSKGAEIEDINMAVPVDILLPILDDLRRKGRLEKPARPWLGAYAAETNGEVVVMSVSQGGPAAQAGLREGDVISDLRDSEIDGLGDFYRKLWASGPAGADIALRIIRDGRDTWLRVTTADRDSFLKKPKFQ